MSFQKSAETLGARLHLENVKPSVLIGILLVVAVIVTSCVLMLGDFLTSSFSVSSTNASDGTTFDSGIENASGEGEQNGEAGLAGDGSAMESSQICVYVSGCVANPGVYYLKDGARLHDAIELAGGLTSSAATDSINLARELFDGEHIDIPDEDAVSQSAAGASTEPGGSSGLVNINMATAEELMALDGIGEVTAGKIVADREANGPFASVDDLTRVSGIGEKKLDAIRDSICV